MSDLKRFGRRMRDAGIGDETRIRCTRNHVSYICREHVNNITSQAPGVGIYPNNEREAQDVKAAELNRAVWRDIDARHKMRSLRRSLAQSFVVTGEVALKVFWDPMKGEFLGWDQTFDENGKPLGEPTQAWTGDFVFERVDAYNLFLSPNARSFEESELVGIQKLVEKKRLKRIYKDDPEKVKAINNASTDNYISFDGVTGSFSRDTKGLVCVREYYHRPCVEYPYGYFWITVSDAVLAEGELPGGVFPIAFRAFEEVEGSARGVSVIRVIKPYQMEINRAAGKAIENSVTMGNDRIITQEGSELRPVPHRGAMEWKYTGEKPTIVPGSTGEQYIAYIQSQITEMYQVARVREKPNLKNLDAQAQLYAAIEQKSDFAFYAGKFEDFLVDVTNITLELAKHHYPDDMLIPAIGRDEAINIEEFRTTERYRYSVRVEPQSDDATTLMGRAAITNQVMQYLGNKLDKPDIGALLKQAPFLNGTVVQDELSLDSTSAENDILALDRGQMVPVRKYEDHQYQIRRLTARTKKGDFPMLSPYVRYLYDRKIAEHEQFIQQQKQDTAFNESGYIPMDGPVIKTELRYPNSNGTTSQQKFPYGALLWLEQKLRAQGAERAMLAEMDPAVQADIARARGGMERIGAEAGSMPPFAANM